MFDNARRDALTIPIAGSKLREHAIAAVARRARWSRCRRSAGVAERRSRSSRPMTTRTLSRIGRDIRTAVVEEIIATYNRT